jgi:hypothetical protein
MEVFMAKVKENKIRVTLQFEPSVVEKIKRIAASESASGNHKTKTGHKKRVSFSDVFRWAVDSYLEKR